MEKRNRTFLIVIIVSVMLALTSCSRELNAEQGLGSIRYDVSEEWKNVSDANSALYFDYASDFRVDVRRSRVFSDSVDLLRTEAISDTGGLVVLEPTVESAELITILGGQAHKLRMTGYVQNVKTDFVMVVFISDRTGYVFCFSQPEELSQENLARIERIIASIQPRNTDDPVTTFPNSVQNAERYTESAGE